CPLHAHADDFHAYVASLQIFRPQNDESTVSGRLMPLIGKGHFLKTPLFSLDAEFGLGAAETSAVEYTFTCICHSILQICVVFPCQKITGRSRSKVFFMLLDAQP